MIDTNSALEILGVTFIILLAALVLARFWKGFYSAVRSYKCENMNTHTACDDNRVCIHCRIRLEDIKC
jgi:hypothetical protein